MAFLKKNLGLVAFLVVAVILMGVLGYAIHTTKTQVAESESQIREQQDFFRRIAGSDLALNNANLNIARENTAFLQEKKRNLVKKLAEEYTVPIEYRTRLEIVRMLKDECIQMRTQLENKDIALETNTQYFSFANIATSPTLPPTKQVPLIFRQIRIVNEIVDQIANSYLTELQDIIRPDGLRPTNKGLYDEMPFRIVVVGETKQIQNFVNLLQTSSKYLFFLRSIKLEAEDEALSLEEVDAFQGEEEGGYSRMEEEEMMRMEQEMQRTARDGRRDRYTRDGRRIRTEREGDDEEERAPRRPRHRDDRIVFENPMVTAVLDVDFVEFHSPDEDQSGSL